MFFSDYLLPCNISVALLSKRIDIDQRGGAAAEKRLRAEANEDTLLCGLRWVAAGSALPNGAVVHKIPLSALTTTKDTREQREFNFATGQLARLLGPGHVKAVKQVEIFTFLRVFS